MKKSIILVLVAIMTLAGCLGQKISSKVSATTKADKGVQIMLSDDVITVDGKKISTKRSNAVFIGADIVYYEEGKDETYGKGTKKDEHSKEEADKHTVVTITKPGTYTVSGSLSYGQIAVDLGEDAEDNKEAVVNLILDNVNINCDVASAIVVFNAYECGDDDEESAAPNVKTEDAGFNLILAKDSENVIDGAYVAKIYKDGTTREDIKNDEAKKKYKFDAAIDSQVSFNINAQENGKLIVNADNEGISSALHMTINGGEIIINASDDAINTSEDNVSVLTINGGVITCDAGLGDEGDGIDSNGYITMNGGYVIACANAESQDSGIDSDKGIFVNGGTLLASGNMYDEISSESKQVFMVLSFAQKIAENELIMVTDEKDNPILAFSAVNDYTIASYSSPDLAEGNYHLYKVSSVTGDLNGSIYSNITEYRDAVRLAYTSDFVGGFGGGMRPPMDGERPEIPKEGEMPDGGEIPPIPEGGEMPPMPKGGEMSGRGEGDRRPKMPGQNFGEANTEFNLSKENYQFGGIIESEQ